MHYFQWYVVMNVMVHRFCVYHSLNIQIGKTSAFIGPLVSSAIITASGNNNNMPFAFLFGLYVLFDNFLEHNSNGLTEVYSAQFFCIWWMLERVELNVKSLCWQRQVRMHLESDWEIVESVLVSLMNL